MCGRRRVNSRQHAGDAVADEAGLLAALDLEGETGDDLVPAAAFVCGGSSDTTSETAETPPATEEPKEGGGSASTLEFEADPDGNLEFTTDSATSEAGEVTIEFTNESPVPHDVAIEDSSGEPIGQTETLAEGSDSTTVNLKPGEYKFYCSVSGHRAAGMEGTLTVR